LKVGSAFMAGEPEMIDSSQFILRVPIIYTRRKPKHIPLGDEERINALHHISL